MKKEPEKFMGTLPKMTDSHIYLNVSRLDQGNYELNIMDKNKLIKKATFRKR
jgi:hypothetical protein